MLGEHLLRYTCFVNCGLQVGDDEDGVLDFFAEGILKRVMS